MAFHNYVKSRKIALKFYSFIILAFPIFLICILTIRDIKDIRYAASGIFFLVIVYTIIILLFKLIEALFIKNIPLKKGGILGKHKFRIENVGIRESTEYTKSLLKWKGIQSIEITNKYIYIFINKYMAHVIPKRSFKSEEECMDFLAILKSKTKEHKS